MDIVYIPLIIIILVVLLIFIIRKSFFSIIVFLLISCGLLLFGFHYFGISLKDLSEYKDMSSVVTKAGGKFNYDRDKREFSIKGNDYYIKVRKFDKGTEIKGNSSLINEESTKSMLALFSFASDVFKIEDLKDKDLKNTSSSDITKYFKDGVLESLNNPEKYEKIVRDMEKNNTSFESDKLKIFIKDKKLYLEKSK